MIGGAPLGVTPLGGAHAPAREPAERAIVTAVDIKAEVAGINPLATAFGGSELHVEFALILRPFFRGEAA